MKRILPLTLCAALLLAGCGGPSGGGPSPAQSSPLPSVPGQLMISPTPSAGPSPTPGEPVGPPPPEPVEPDWAAYSLAAPVYPLFPAYPAQPGEDGDWGAYFDAESEYYRAVSALREGCDPALVRGNPSLVAFAAKSAPLALAGHEGENAIYSPLSLWSALAMAAQCAGGDSRQQVLDALGAADMDSLTELVGQVWRMLYTDDGRDALTLANSVWLNDAAEGSYVQETLDRLANGQFAGVYSVPMGTEDADRAVSGWVSDQTHGLIGGDEPIVRTRMDTLALLVSSLYYRAGWEDEFYPENTREDTFTAAGGEESRVDFMHSNRDGAFLLRPGYRAAYLPTRLGEMVFVLPDEGVTPESLLDDPDFLSGLNFNGAGVTHIDGEGVPDPATAAHWGEVQWSIPKFDVNSGLKLLDTLKALGITDLLDPSAADLSSLTDIPAYLSDALQLARVKVDEEGVEAAAVTILMMAGSAMPPEDPEVCVMDLDRPFLFVVRCQDLPLFVGIVNQAG